MQYKDYSFVCQCGAEAKMNVAVDDNEKLPTQEELVAQLGERATLCLKCRAEQKENGDSD